MDGPCVCARASCASRARGIGGSPGRDGRRDSSRSSIPRSSRLQRGRRGLGARASTRRIPRNRCERSIRAAGPPSDLLLVVGTEGAIGVNDDRSFGLAPSGPRRRHAAPTPTPHTSYVGNDASLQRVQTYRTFIDAPGRNLRTAIEFGSEVCGHKGIVHGGMLAAALGSCGWVGGMVSPSLDAGSKAVGTSMERGERAQNDGCPFALGFSRPSSPPGR